MKKFFNILFWLLSIVGFVAAGVMVGQCIYSLAVGGTAVLLLVVILPVLLITAGVNVVTFIINLIIGVATENKFRLWLHVSFLVFDIAAVLAIFLAGTI